MKKKVLSKNHIFQKLGTSQKPKSKGTPSVTIMAAVSLLLIFVIWKAFLFSHGKGMKSIVEIGETPDLKPQIVYAALALVQNSTNTSVSSQYEGRGPADIPTVYHFRWFVNDAVVQEGSESELPAGIAKKGESVSLEIVASNSYGLSKPFKTTAITIGNLPPVITSISLLPSDPVPGVAITAEPVGEDPDDDFISYEYQWTVIGETEAAAPTENNTFNTEELRKKDRIAVVVTPSDGMEKGEPVISEAISLSNSAPHITSTPPISMVNGTYVYQVQATDRDDDKIFYSLITSPSGMTINSETGLIRWQPQEGAGSGEISIKIKVDDGDGGSDHQQYSLFLEVK